MTTLADAAIAEIAALRNRATAAHKRCTAPGSPCRTGCGVHPPWPDATTWSRPGPSTPADWAGLARMAAARRHAGQPLTDLDLQALTHTTEHT